MSLHAGVSGIPHLQLNRRDNLNGWDRYLNNFCRFETLAIATTANDDGSGQWRI